MATPVDQLCKRRKITPLDLLTPILIPSFSSKGFPEFDWLWKNSKNYLNDVALVSSYDIYYDLIDAEIEATNIVMVDSGGYEARKDYDLSEIYGGEYEPREWDREKHRFAIGKIKTLSPLILISYDELNNHDISTQVKEANSFFAEFDEATTDFLIKPTQASFIDIDNLEANLHLLANFDILGVTEKELGNSLVERLQNVVRLRKGLSHLGLEIPIHIFGCLDPICVWLFYLCGADLFDGLSWLRFAFYENVPVYRNSWAVLNGQAAIPDDELILITLMQNLDILNKQRLLMARFTEHYDFAALPIKLEAIQNVLGQAEVSLVERSA
ncbi:MAG: hypothetical protein GY797_39680 [Deltaproteobacteria bacterium]|nr:hypothetical protein [Deltaproteobacteria bacterium]